MRGGGLAIPGLRICELNSKMKSQTLVWRLIDISLALPDLSKGGFVVAWGLERLNFTLKTQSDDMIRCHRGPRSHVEILGKSSWL